MLFNHLSFIFICRSLDGHKHNKVCQLETLAIFLENIHKVYFNVLNA
jgi:hypothetical protein